MTSTLEYAVSDESWRTKLKRQALNLQIVEVSFIVFLSIVIAGDHPFADRSPEALAANLTQINDGDPIRQLTYLFLFVMISLFTIPKLGFKALNGMAIPHVLSVIWCILSITWSVDPMLCARRGALLIIVVGTIVQVIQYLGIERALKILYWVLAGTILVCWISLAITPNAIHPATEDDRALIGCWRGPFYHKNIAGGVLGLTTLLFMHYAIRYRRWFDFVLFVLAFGFLIGTHSKTSWGFTIAAAIFSIYYIMCWRSAVGRYIFLATFYFILSSIVILIVGYYDDIVKKLSDPHIFTGRGEIWQAVWVYVKGHPLLGAGYSTFWLTDDSPIYQHPVSAFLTTVPHSHSSYMETLATGGIIGFILVILGFVVVPLALFLSADRSNADEKAMLFSIWLFTILHSFLETDFFARDKQVWVIFLFSITIVQLRRRRTKSGIVAPPVGRMYLHGT